MEALSSYMNWLEGLVLGSSNRKTTGPWSKPSHLKEGPQKISKPRRKAGDEHTVWRVARGAVGQHVRGIPCRTRRWAHSVESGQRSRGQHVWGIPCTVIWAPLGGSSLFNPFQYLIWIYLLFTNFLSACIWHDNTFLNEDKVSSAIFLWNLQQKWRDRPNIYWMCIKCWVQISVSHIYQSAGNVILARGKGQLEKLKPAG